MTPGHTACRRRRHETDQSHGRLPLLAAVGGRRRGRERRPRLAPVSPGLRGGLLRWADEFDAILNHEDPAASGFPSAAAERQFDEDGRRLAARLAAELRETHEVLYYSVAARRVEPVGPRR